MDNAMMIIDAAKAIFPAKHEAIFVLKFTLESPMSIKEFCEFLQDRLYDDIGTSGYFRIAPKAKENLTMDFIEFAGKDAKVKEYYESGNNEHVVAFAIRETDEEVSLTKELGIFSDELELLRKDVSPINDVQQMGVNSMY